jgi:hypothetical protein
MHDAALPGSAFFGVRIPALNANFLSYYDEQNRLMLASIATDRSLGVAKSKFMPASQMFAVLVPVAQRFNEMSN